MFDRVAVGRVVDSLKLESQLIDTVENVVDVAVHVIGDYANANYFYWSLLYTVAVHYDEY